VFNASVEDYESKLFAGMTSYCRSVGEAAWERTAAATGRPERV